TTENVVTIGTEGTVEDRPSPGRSFRILVTSASDQMSGDSSDVTIGVTIDVMTDVMIGETIAVSTGETIAVVMIVLMTVERRGVKNARLTGEMSDATSVTSPATTVSEVVVRTRAIGIGRKRSGHDATER